MDRYIIFIAVVVMILFVQTILAIKDNKNRLHDLESSDIQINSRLEKLEFDSYVATEKKKPVRE